MANALDDQNNIKEQICDNCYWYRPNERYSDIIRCLNLERETWHGIEERNTCKDFVLPQNFKPDRALSALVVAVNKAIKANTGKM